MVDGFGAFGRLGTGSWGFDLVDCGRLSRSPGSRPCLSV